MSNANDVSPDMLAFIIRSIACEGDDFVGRLTQASDGEPGAGARVVLQAAGFYPPPDFTVLAVPPQDVIAENLNTLLGQAASGRAGFVGDGTRRNLFQDWVEWDGWNNAEE